MSDFSPSWLALREPVDAQARSVRLAARLARWLAARPAPDRDTPLTVLDLGCGTGSNLRWLAPRLGGRQVWTCLDRDPELLAALQRETAAWARGRGLDPGAGPRGLHIAGAGACWRVQPRRFDLAGVDRTLVATGEAGSPAFAIAPGTLVTASALLDLVSASWLLGLLHISAAAEAPLLLALTYDGRVGLEPRHGLDGPVIGLVNAHQCRDKGLGPALGPSAPARLTHLAEGLGFTVAAADSDWLLTPDQTGMQAALVAGWAAAAGEQSATGADPAPAARHQARILDWRDARLAWIGAGVSRLSVGHQDALLLPP